MMRTPRRNVTNPPPPKKKPNNNRARRADKGRLSKEGRSMRCPYLLYTATAAASAAVCCCGGGSSVSAPPGSERGYRHPTATQHTHTPPWLRLRLRHSRCFILCALETMAPAFYNFLRRLSAHPHTAGHTHTHTQHHHHAYATVRALSPRSRRG